ncbi:hypothetical protein PR048_020809 [Dryococelus australis]|uniref:Uncharacterized protein n=1 Tax=Dryococelus australis TaxID=614101 RepID=A0ABQ9GWG5_9NEOP|nr:hypothetical protein PR048_020809 [Dryococelus australis]
MRTRPSSSTGKTPAEAVGRTFRTHLTLMHPALEPLGELIWMMKYGVRKSTWLPGVVCDHSVLVDTQVSEPSVDDKSQMPASEAETLVSRQLLDGTTAQHMPSSKLLQAARQENPLPTMPQSLTLNHRPVSTLVVAAAQHLADDRPLPIFYRGDCI